MGFNRKIFPELKAHLLQKQVTVLTGMRRTGKTTLVKQLMETSDIAQKLFFDLERLDNRKLFNQENYELIIQSLEQQNINFSKKVLICLDEIQLVPNLPSVIKYLYDNYDIKFIVTGSSSYYIKNKFQESLAGRKKIFEIFPLDFGEYLTFNGINYKSIDDINLLKNNSLEFDRLQLHYNNYIEFGGFPQVVLSKNSSEKKDFLQDIINSYINIDIVQFADIRKINDLEQLIRLLASRIGSKLDISKLSNTVNLSRQTVENYIYLLENTYFIKTIPVYSLNVDREIVKARKIYFLDNGIASMFSEMGSGAKFENAVFNQLHHFGEVSYYQMKTGQEIDFILDKKIAFEVKETAQEVDYKKMMNLAKNINITDGFILGKNNNNNFDAFVWAGMIR
jgi:predicted AAA+ superfamily ATPase